MLYVDAGQKQIQTSQMRGLALLAAVGLLASLASLNAAPVATLSEKDIAEAIQLGNFGEPRPYALHVRGADAARRNPVELADVYTPFVRVALATRAARDAGHVLAPDDVDPKLLEPLVYIAFRWFGRDSTRPDSDYLRPELYWIFSRDLDFAGMPRRDRGVDPLWVKRGAEGAAVLGSFGAEPPHDDYSLVAAFPIDMLRTDAVFVLYRTLLPRPPTPPHPLEMLTEGEVLPDELGRWR